VLVSISTVLSISPAKHRRSDVAVAVTVGRTVDS
jgi:hypothetical protein